MLIDSIIGRLKSNFHEADGFLDKLIIGSHDGDITVQWEYGIEITFQEHALLRTGCPERLVLDRLQDMLVLSHREVERTARSMGVSDGGLHPPRRPNPWFCKMCNCEVSDMTIAEHAVYQHDMTDAVSS